MRYLSRAFFAVGAIAVLREDADHGSGDSDCLIGGQEETTVRGKLPMASDPAEQNAEVDACGYAAALTNFNGDEADVVGIRNY
jgi:hypothetical protein